MVPNGWSLIKLGEILTLSSGETKPTDIQKECSDSAPYPVYGGNNIMGYSSQKNSSSPIILIGRVGEYCGVTRYIDKACWITDNALYTKTVSPEINKEYLVSKLKKFDLSRLRNKGGQPLVSQKPIYAVKLPIPPLQEQQKIAKILSTWDKAIATTEKLIATSLHQKKALMQQLLTGEKRLVNPETGKVFEGDWEEIHTGEHINLVSGHAFKSTEFEKNTNFKLLRGINISQGYLRWEPEQTYSWTDATDYKKYIMKIHDVVISMDGSLVGRNYALITENNIEPMLLVQRVARLRCKPSLHHGFLLQHIASDRFKSYVDAVKTVTAIPHISAKDIRQFRLSLPRYDEQQKIALVLTAADKEIELLQAKLAHLKDEKKALMQQLLTGKRRVQVN